MFVDSDLAGEKCTKRSCIGFLVYLNTALISWSSKKKSPMYRHAFLAQFVAMKTGVTPYEVNNISMYDEYTC